MHDRVSELAGLMHGIANGVGDGEEAGSAVDPIVCLSRDTPARVVGQQDEPQNAFKLDEQADNVSGFEVTLRPLEIPITGLRRVAQALRDCLAYFDILVKNSGKLLNVNMAHSARSNPSASVRNVSRFHVCGQSSPDSVRTIHSPFLRSSITRNRLGHAYKSTRPSA